MKNETAKDRAGESGSGKEKKLKECQDLCRKLDDKYKRALADYQNLLKQTSREKQEYAKYANEQLIMEVLPVYDNLKMALMHADGQEGPWLEGVKYVTKQFKDVLEKMGIEEIEAKGCKFDPNLMDAVEGRGEKVKNVVKPGYVLNGKLISPAKVILE